jgi:hypothetical protein
MSISGLYPNLRPSLLLDFAQAGRLDPRISFSRASSATVYDGVTVAKAEENLLLQSQDFTTSWSNVATSDTADTTVAPDGTTTADTITATGTGAHYVQQTSLSTAGTQRVLSCFVKAGTNNYVQIGFGTSVTAYANFDVTSGAGAVGTVGATATASIVDAGNGWFRCIVITSDATASALCFIAIIQSSTDTRLQSFVAAGTETIILWGAQLEQRSAVTAYTPTTTQPITNYIPVLQTAAAGVARFDHNPTTGEAEGLLIEEQRSNLFTYSEDFANADWTKSDATITSNTIVAPDGTLTGDKLVEDATTATHLVRQSESLTTGNKYTVSIFAKAAERTQLRIQFGTAAGAFSGLQTADFNFSTITATGGNNAVATMTPVGNGWYRCIMTTDTTTGTQSMNVQIMLRNAGVSSYAGDGYSGIFLWGAMLEEGAFSTSYIKTTSASATRNADDASMTGTNFSSWYNASEGTLYVEAQLQGVGGLAPAALVSIDDVTTNNRIILRRSLVAGTANFRFLSSAGSIDANLLSGSNTGLNKMIAAFKAGDQQSANNGTLFTGITPVASLPIVTRLAIGDGTGSTPASGTIRKIAYYPQRLSDAQLVALTG